MRKIRDELRSGGLKDPNEIIRDCARGPGSKSLNDFAVSVVMAIYLRQPATTLKNYVAQVFSATGILVGRSTISRLFNYGFQFCGSLRMPNCVPLDKFKPLNILRLDDYRAVLQLLLYMDSNHHRLREAYQR